MEIKFITFQTLIVLLIQVRRQSLTLFVPQKRGLRKDLKVPTLETSSLKIIGRVNSSRFITIGCKLSLILSYRWGFQATFCIVADFIQWSKDNDIPVGPGRGSGAGSLVAYSLHITNMNPLPYNLLFERFINLERISMPDFDIDFCQDRRPEVIEYVTQKYGARESRTNYYLWKAATKSCYSRCIKGLRSSLCRD